MNTVDSHTVTSIGGYSAHADQQGVVEFVAGSREWPREIWVVHGLQQAKHDLAIRVYEEYRQHGGLLPRS